MTDKDKFEDFLFEKWIEFTQRKGPNDDVVVEKNFSSGGEKCSIIARFSKKGGYCNGLMISRSRGLLVNGKGFSIEEFIEFIRKAMEVKVK